jgi:hypothetical protein
MPAYEYAFTLTPGGGRSRTRSLAIACAAVVGVCALSSAVVMRELVGAPIARAASVAPASTARTLASNTLVSGTLASSALVSSALVSSTWALEPRWWPVELREAAQQAARPARTSPDNELTFARGYAQREAARQAAAAAARIAAIDQPPAESQSGRTAAIARKAGTIAHIDPAPTIRRVSIRPDAGTDQPGRLDAPNRALAFEDERPRRRGFPAPWFGNLFGNLY